MVNFDNDRDVKLVETDYVKMVLKKGIFYMYYKSLKQLDLNIAKAIVKERLAFVDGESYPSLFDIQKVEHSTKDARDYMADEGNDLVLASAIMVGSPVLRMMANFFIMVNKPKNPTRMFTDEKSAVEWLEQFKA